MLILTPRLGTRLNLGYDFDRYPYSRDGRSLAATDMRRRNGLNDLGTQDHPRRRTRQSHMGVAQLKRALQWCLH
jgi:hypothetical protein